MSNILLRIVIRFLFSLMSNKGRKDIYNRFETFGDLYYMLKNKDVDYSDDLVKYYFMPRD